MVEERCSGIGGWGWGGERRLLSSLAQAPVDVCIRTELKNEDRGRSRESEGAVWWWGMMCIGMWALVIVSAGR